jgi:Glycosyl transferases group 1
MSGTRILYVIDKLESLGSSSVAMLLDVWGASQYADVDCIVINDKSKINNDEILKVQAAIGARSVIFSTWEPSVSRSIYHAIIHPLTPLRSSFESESLNNVIHQINMSNYDAVVVGAIGVLLYPSISQLKHKLIYFKVHDLFSNSLWRTYKSLPISKLLKKVFYLREFLTMKILEKEALHDSRIKRIYMANSDEIRQYLHNNIDVKISRKVKQLPFAIKHKLPDSRFTEILGEDINLLFCGANGLLNLLGIQWFIKNIYPNLIFHNKTINLNIVGGICDAIAERSLINHPNIKLSGFVENLDSEYFKAHIVIIPLIAGSGVKVKLLEAVTYKKPIVTTSIGIEGTNFPNLDSISVADNPDRFAQKILMLVDQIINESEKTKTCVESNFDYISHNYDPQIIGKLLVQDIEQDIFTQHKSIK